MKRYTTEDAERLVEIQEAMSKLVYEVVEITREDSYVEAYFTEKLSQMIDGSANPYDLDFAKVINRVDEQIRTCPVCEVRDTHDDECPVKQISAVCLDDLNIETAADAETHLAECEDCRPPDVNVQAALNAVSLL